MFPFDIHAPSIQTTGVAKKFLTVDETAAKLDISRQRVYEMIWDKRLKGIKDPDTRTWLIEEGSVNAFVKKPRGRPKKNP